MVEPEEPVYRRRRPAGWRLYVLAGGLLALLLMVAVAFPFVWIAIKGRDAAPGGVVNTVLGTGTYGAGPVYPNGYAPATVARSDTVAWPTGQTLREKWENRTPGQGTSFGWYMSSLDASGYVWSEGLAQPIEGEAEWVLLLEWPRGDAPDSPREMRISSAKLVPQPNGDVMPQSQWGAPECLLNAEQAKRVMEQGMPDSLLEAMREAIRKWPGAAQTYGNPTRLEVSKYFEEPEPESPDEK